MRSLWSRIVPVATYGGEVSSTLSRKVLRLCGCALTTPYLLPRRELFFAAIPNKTHRCVGERLVVKVTLRSSSLGEWRMGTIAFSCATLGFVLSVRFKAFALVPASLLALGPTLVFGFVNGWGTLGLVLATMANLIILQASYCVGGILLRRFGKPAERRAPRLRHMRVMRSELAG
jgi:hypothetical protein